MTAAPIPPVPPRLGPPRDYTLPAAEPKTTRLEPVPPLLPEPPLLCRLGLHRLRVDVVQARRRTGLTELCSVTTRCARPGCAMVRHEQHRPLPRRRR